MNRGATATPAVGLGELLLYFLRLGSIGFGGPVALVGAMQRDLVEDRRWFTAGEYREGLALAQLAPGPLAAQLAIYLGWARGGALSAALVGLAFVLPSFVMVLGIAVAYTRFGGLPWMQGAFYGIGAAVIAVIARSAARLTRLTLGSDRLLWGLFLAAAFVTAWTESEIVWVFVAAGVLALLARSGLVVTPAKALSVVLLPAGLFTGLGGQAASPATLWRIAWYFSEAGAFVFGSGLAIVPFLHSGVVQEFRWLDERQFLDAVAVAMITPGPVVITVGFIGYLVAGLAGAGIAALATFLPCYLFTVIPAPHFQRLSRNKGIKAFVDGVTAAATGAIAGAVFVLGRRALVDLTTLAIAAATLWVLVRVRRVPEPLLITAAGVLGILLTTTSVRVSGGEPMTTPSPAQSVVFVCEHGSAKSLVAASWFNRLAQEQGLAVRSSARGRVPDASVPAAVVEALRGDGFDVSGFRPQRLVASDVAPALRVIGIGIDLGPAAAAAGGRAVRWDEIPPVSAGYAAARDAMRARIEALLDELRKDPDPGP